MTPETSKAIAQATATVVREALDKLRGELEPRIRALEDGQAIEKRIRALEDERRKDSN